MGEPSIVKTMLPVLDGSNTWGSETSQYPEEKKIMSFLMTHSLSSGERKGKSPKSFVFYTNGGCREILSGQSSTKYIFCI